MKDNLSGNIGEWSELYAFCFLAGQGIVYCANEAAEKTGEFLPIKGFRRIGSGGEAIAYLCAHDVIRVMDADNQVCFANSPKGICKTGRIFISRNLRKQTAADFRCSPNGRIHVKDLCFEPKGALGLQI